MRTVADAEDEKIAEIRSGIQQFGGPTVLLRQPVHPVHAEQQPAGAAVAPGARRRTGPTVAAVTAVPHDDGVAAVAAVGAAVPGVAAGAADAAVAVEEGAVSAAPASGPR